MFNPLQLGIELAERGALPDSITRQAIRQLCAYRAKEAKTAFSQNATAAFVRTLRSEPIALHPDQANAQHYELPPEFFGYVLGKHRKYSCCYFTEADCSLDKAEEAALSLTCQHADLQNGQTILELGCGWGSLSLWMARQYPDSQIVAVSNSTPQRRYIEQQIIAQQLLNLQVITADMNDFNPLQTFDRIVSVEMFEHLRNYEEVLQRIALWLRPEGKLFVHHFCHRNVAYPFETQGAANWMGRYFFTGGLMPNAKLLSGFDKDLKVTHHWAWDGTHYHRTAEAWLNRLDEQRQDVLPILAQTYGKAAAKRWFHRWHLFFLAVSELFGYAEGKEWFVVHLLLEPVDALVATKAYPQFDEEK